jgi:D-alanyl-D-alanine carboxypeptidase/D-alanyl-D-alanine-endopeptidase (penicillin-binding protein 4)
VNELRTEGSSDKSIIYTAPYSDVAYINGSLPAKEMKVSGAMPNPPKQLAIELAEELKKQNIDLKEKLSLILKKLSMVKNRFFPENKVILEYKSPTLDKIVYWFLKKSVNLFGETFMKTMAKENRKS